MDCAFWQWNDVWLSDAFRSFDIRPECERLTAPLLAIQGVDDPYGTMLQIEALAAASPGLEGSVSRKNDQNPLSVMHRQLQKLEQCGHAPHHDQAALTTRLISDFLRDRA